MRTVTLLRDHWPEYLIEGWALGMFMISAGAFTIAFEASGSPLRVAIEDPDLRRVLIGVAMGLTAVALIYSPWGKRSGAHMNPAVTLTFLRLGKIGRADAVYYVAAQVVGGTAGVLVVALLAGPLFTEPPVNYVVTVPGAPGIVVAFAAEFVISLGLMLTILGVSNAPRLAPYTGLFAGTLVALYISIEAPLSGMSINPARTLASAVPAGSWTGLWIYLLAPPLGMLTGAEIYRAIRGRGHVHCAKLQHPDDVRCIHCGHRPTGDLHNDRPLPGHGGQLT